MFKKNIDHTQADIFGLYNTLPDNMKKKVKKSEHYTFYKLIFCNIKEALSSKLYSDKKSRPNAPINAMFASLILMHRYNWTYEQLFEHIQFHILVKIALELDSIDEMPFCPATLFNFQNRLAKHFIQTGENLLEQVFDQLTEKQLKTLKLKTSIQRTDSFAAASNIRNYSRLQLLVELVIRIYRILSDKDKKRFLQHFGPYINKTSGQYIYPLQTSDIPHEIEKIGHLYRWIAQNLKHSYAEYDIFKTFERVYAEHFTIVHEKIEVKSNNQLTSGSVQSPDDLPHVGRRGGRADASRRDPRGHAFSDLPELREHPRRAVPRPRGRPARAGALGGASRRRSSEPLRATPGLRRARSTGITHALPNLRPLRALSPGTARPGLRRRSTPGLRALRAGVGSSPAADR